MEPHCKIGKIKLRNGAEVRVYENNSPFMCSAMRTDFLRNVREIHDELPGLAGYVIVGWDRSGHHLRATRAGYGSTLSQAMLPAYVFSILQRDITQ